MADSHDRPKETVAERSHRLALVHREAMTIPHSPAYARSCYEALWVAVRGLAYKVCKAIHRRCPGCDIQDLVSDLACELPRIVQNYDPSRGVPFVPYFVRSAWSIVVTRYLATKTTIRVTRRNLKDKSLPVLSRVAANVYRVGRVRAADPGDGFERDEGPEYVRGLMRSLDERTTEIIRLRYGFDGGETLSFHEIGKRTNFSYQGANNRHQKGILALRAAIG